MNVLEDVDGKNLLRPVVRERERGSCAEVFDVRSVAVTIHVDVSRRRTKAASNLDPT
jgi:hypothetical protein